MSNRFQFATLSEQDFPDALPDVVRLVNSAYRGEESRRGWTTEADFLTGQRTDVATLSRSLSGASNRRMVVARELPGFPIVGCVFLEKFEDARGVGCYLGMLTVSPRMQNQGLGKALLAEAECVARDWGAQRITLGVIYLRDSLMAWYERHRYRKTGETQPFPYDDPSAGTPLRDDLRFVIFEREF